MLIHPDNFGKQQQCHFSHLKSLCRTYIN